MSKKRRSVSVNEKKINTYYHKFESHEESRNFIEEVDDHILYNGIKPDDYGKVYLYGEKHSGIKTTSSPQNFEELRQHHLQNKTLFKDDSFPPETITLKKVHASVEWKRPCEISRTPRFVIDGVTRFDIDQGYLGDCWFLAAIANITANPRIFQFVIPMDQDFNTNYAGIFHFRFWQYGRWIDIVVDDRLPTVNDQLLYLTSSNPNEFWAPLLEKAYAKLYGSYKNIEGGQISEALEDMCGGFSESFSADRPEIYDILKMSYERSSFMGCCIMSSVLEGNRKDGLITRHAYSITKVDSFTVDGTETKLIRIRNPWGNSAEWNGTWSDNSDYWNLVPNTIREKFLVQKADGEFWMAIEDFQKCFSYVDICHLNPSTFFYSDGDNAKWNVKMFEGAWIPNVTAGGSYLNLQTFANNPQYYMGLMGPKDGMSSVLIGLMQKNRRVLHKNELPLELAIYKVEGKELLEQPFFESNNPILHRTENGFRQLTIRIMLPPGRYCIIPSTAEPNMFAEYLLRIYSEAKMNVMENDHDVSCTPQAVLNHPAAYEAPIDNAFPKLFKKVSKGQIEIGADNIQKALNLKYGKRNLLVSWFRKPKEIFSKTSSKNIVALWDSDYSGKLNYQEFCQLMSDVAILEKIFKKFDLDGSGKLNGFEFRNLLAECGYKVNKQILRILMFRYGQKDFLDFENFVVSAFKLKTMIEEFYKRKNTDNNDYINIERGDWLTTTLYS